ncbi:transcription regulator [Pyrenophora seminiperda CCB06]|uniref:Transcription regulator n=1 Tax=Pyrenophora seminiperda CCB06 TaxID=1302712 RepID=A0A3M7M200_9PLEO|nr:transcription regulator [Pyrenophora seminiperda CCB06]
MLHANPDIRRAFAEFQDQDTPSKCNKVRCLHCGFVRAKNTTRQIEHLVECQPYLASPEAQAHQLAQQQQNGTPVEQQSMPAPGPSQILNGQQPNPNLQVHRRGPNSKRPRDGQLLAPNIAMTPSVAPSLTSHLLTICSAPFTQATQQPFLSHAGCGSIGAGPLLQWLVQDSHYARAFIRFVGQLLAKIRLPVAQNSQFHPMFRTMDLLISALNNMRREMQFFEITTTKYGLVLPTDAPSPITRALIDLFVSATSPSASVLEGMVALWGTEHVYRTAWHYAATFSPNVSSMSNEPHIAALHQALLPNWISPAFDKFVEASRTLVDELANITTTRDGKEEMQRCEEVFRQTCWLAERIWPSVDGMGEEDENTGMGPPRPSMVASVDTDMQNGMQTGLPIGINANNMQNNMSAPMVNMHGNPVPNNISGPVNNNNNPRNNSASSNMNGTPVNNTPRNAAVNSNMNGTPVNNQPRNASINSGMSGAQNSNTRNASISSNMSASGQSQPRNAAVNNPRNNSQSMPPGSATHDMPIVGNDNRNSNSRTGQGSS